MDYDLIIVGGGPAACAAAVYAARKRLKTLLIAEEIGGQSSVSNTIYNWIGTKEVGGTELAQNLRAHIEAYISPEHTLTLRLGERVEHIAKDGAHFTVATAKDTFRTKSVLVATGSRHRKLEVPGAETFEHKGIMYCATCDGPLFTGMPVAVIGGGNAAIEGALQLAQYASQVTIIHRNDNFKADEITIEQVRALPNVTIETNAQILEIKGDKFVSGIVYTKNDEQIELPVNAVFVEIGQLPNTDLAKEIITLDSNGKIIVDPMNQRTTTAGIWAAGDCTNGLYHQNNIAAGDAVKALEDIFVWLKTNK